MNRWLMDASWSALCLFCGAAGYLTLALALPASFLSGSQSGLSLALP